MRHLSLAGALAVGWLWAAAGPVAGAELTGGCALEVRSTDGSGAPLDEGTVPPGTEGSQQNPFRVAWDGRVDFRFSTGTTVFQNNEWEIHAQGIPLPILRGADDNPMDRDESGDVQIGESVPGPIVGLFYVSGTLEGNSGASRCDGNGWVHVVGDPMATVPFWVMVGFLVLGGGLLVATPYTRDWEEAGLSAMPGGPARPEGS